MATGDIASQREIFQKNIDCAEFMCVRFTIDSDFELTEYEIQSQIFTWPGLFWNQSNVDDVFN